MDLLFNDSRRISATQKGTCPSAHLCTTLPLPMYIPWCVYTSRLKSMMSPHEGCKSLGSIQHPRKTSKASNMSIGLKSKITKTIPWASHQIRKIAGCACAGNAENVFPRRRFQRKPLVSDPSMHHGTCMSGSLTCGDGENVPGIPGACASAIFAYL